MSTVIGSSEVLPGAGIVLVSPTTGNDYGRCVTVLPDGDVLLLGQSDNGSSTSLRLRADGSVETGFGTLGSVSLANFKASAVVLLGNTLVLAGSANSGGVSASQLVAIDAATGSVASGFGQSGRVVLPFTDNPWIRTEDPGKALVVHPDGKIVFVGTALVSGARQFAAARLNGDGTLDATFNSTGLFQASVGTGGDEAQALSLQSDGKIFLVGQFCELGQAVDAVVGGNVSLDLGTGLTERVFSVTEQSDGRIVHADTTTLNATNTG